MATYFHGNSEIQAADHGIQTLFLMNPNYVPFSDTASLPNNTLLLNPAGNALNPSIVPHAPPSNTHYHHPLVGIPLPAPSTSIAQNNSEDINRTSLHGIFSGLNYDSWSSIDQNSPQTQTQMASLAAASSCSQLGLRRPVASSCRQGLSLSLSSQQAGYSRPINVEGDTQARGQVSAISTGAVTKLSENSPSSVSVVSNGISSIRSVVLGSKYLRAVQELLDEVVNVGNVTTDSTEGAKEKKLLNKETMAVMGEGSNGGGESSPSRQAELTTPQRQELQMKKAKLVNMLDEVEQRYRQYHQQMQVVISSFEQVAGFGSAKSYAALALRTISKQFRCLKDAISTQIKATSKKLGEDDCLGAKIESSRLRYVDHQLRQKRVLQLGMMQHNAWRPQRGLPERAVTILRAWLFEHFLHPYPKDSDKHILAKQTGLTRSQVSNWFINARVRLWKPMVEEMYLEEMKEQERNGSEDNVSKTEVKDSGPNTTFPKDSISLKFEEKSINQNASPNSTISTQTGFNLIDVQRIQKKPKGTDIEQGETASREINVSFEGNHQRLNKDGYTLVTGTHNHGGGFDTYTLGDIGRFNPDHDHQLAPRFHGNGVSLTLGLPQQNLLSNQNIELDFCGIDTAQPSHSTTMGYDIDNFDIQKRKRLAAHLLPDFVT